MPFRVAIVFLVGLGLLSGCASPIGVDRVSPRDAYINAYTNPSSLGELSDSSRFVLNRYNLLKQFGKEPAATIETLHKIALHDNRGIFSTLWPRLLTFMVANWLKGHARMIIS